MKKIIFLAALLATSSAFAFGGSDSSANATANPTSAANASVTANPTSTMTANPTTTSTTTANTRITSSVNQTFTSPDKQRIEYGGDYTLKNVPSVNGPALTTSNDTCMGSTSGSVNIAGVGVGGGSTWVDENCKMLKNSRELWNMGMKAAAMALMCSDDKNRDALELTGFKCPQTKRDEEAKAAMAKASLTNGPQRADIVDGSNKPVLDTSGNKLKQQ